jgi:riboflavin biosynthesis pyrimidine reductase
VTTRFEQFAAMKTEQAVRAVIPGFRSIEDYAEQFSVVGLGNEWTTGLFDGLFYVSAADRDDLPLVNGVFVRSREGNTLIENPADLGGGEGDKHLIYEGLSRVHVDAVLAGAATVRGSDVVFSVWHPEAAALRASFGLPRHPAQIVVTARGALDIDRELLFTTPELRVFVLAPRDGIERLSPRVRDRPWIRLVPLTGSTPFRQALATLKRDHHIHRMSIVGGRTMMSTLLAERLVQDVYLTTTPISAGHAGTPYYGDTPPRTTLVLKKEAHGPEAGVVFEHLRVVPA